MRKHEKLTCLPISWIILYIITLIFVFISIIFNNESSYKLPMEILAGWRLTIKCQTLPPSDRDIIRLDLGLVYPESQRPWHCSVGLHWPDGWWRLQRRSASAAGVLVLGEGERGKRDLGTRGKVYTDIDHIQFPAPHFSPVALSGWHSRRDI